eukprot:TRINITY_DN1650_c0_g1_i5.p1 TRINITY_DN1650_c0_g1~~TRINITY_DN1650_c0_g1_i5.p1  ORF type:complete len:415 (-),score=72.49 TRINITY_DN1650_c0_g1_i5:103-1347(-)
MHVMREHEVKLLLPQDSQLQAEYSRAKSRSMLLHRCLTESFFTQLGNRAIVLEVTDKKREHDPARRSSPPPAQEEGQSPCASSYEEKTAVVYEPTGTMLVACDSPVKIVFAPPYLTPRATSPTQMTVVVSLNWRRKWNFQHNELFRGFSSATCYRPGTREEISCSKCQKSADEGSAPSVVSITPKDSVVTTDVENATESYLFKITSLCSSSRLHMECTRVVLAFRIAVVTVLSPPVQLRSRLLPADRKNAVVQSPPLRRNPESPQSPHTAEGRGALLHCSPLLHCLPAATPFCAVVRIIRNNVNLSPEQWKIMVKIGWTTFQSSLKDSALSFKSVNITNADACNIISGKYEQSTVHREVATTPTKWWYVLHIACYSSTSAVTQGSSITRAMLQSFGSDTEGEAVTQVLFTFCNW